MEMSSTDLWKKYCSFYEKPFSEQLEFNRQYMKEYFEKWKKTDLTKMLCKDTPQSYKDVPITTYNDYPMLTEFAQKITEVTEKNPRRNDELLSEYYMRINRQAGAFLDRYMIEPFYACAKTTGSTGASKWHAYGETFAKTIISETTEVATISCSNGWGETKLREGDTALNITAPVPYISGWGAAAFQRHFKLLPSLRISENLKDMKEKFYFVLKSIERKERLDVAGGIGSMFYMICKYFIEPEEFYVEYYRSMSLNLKKVLLMLKILQCKLSRKETKKITDYMPLKGVAVGGMDSQLYIEFFKKEFGLNPLHTYGSTEAGNVMKGDPDRKTDLIPDLEHGYLEFQTKEGQIKDIYELKKGEVYDFVITPFGSIFFRYDMEDLFKVVDFRDDDMPVFAFEGRKGDIIDIYGYYRVTPHIMVQTLLKAGLSTSDKWAVTKTVEPKEHLLIIMEKSWSYSEKDAEKVIFESLKETLNDFKSYVEDFNIVDPSEAIKVEYLKPGAFLRYTALKAKMGVAIGQYKPPQIIPADRLEIYETLKSV